MLKKVLSCLLIGAGGLILIETGLVFPSFMIIGIGALAFVLSCEFNEQSYHSSTSISYEEDDNDEFEEYQFYKSINKK